MTNAPFLSPTHRGQEAECFADASKTTTARPQAPTNCKRQDTVLVLRNGVVAPTSSIPAGTSAAKALTNVGFIET